IHALKYRGLPRVADELAEAVARIPIPGRGRAWLVPVPLGPRRQRERGYNQSERLARALGRRWQRPVADLLVRVRDTAAQTALTPEARLANVAGAFEVRNGRSAECGMRSAESIRSEEHTSELQSRFDLVCRLLLEKKKMYSLHNEYPMPLLILISLLLLDFSDV